MKKHPFGECAESALAHVVAGRTIHQQFQCAHCGVKQTMEAPNRFFTRGKCEECGKESNLLDAGCNYAVIL
jgi:hypothetical protein